MSEPVIAFDDVHKSFIASASPALSGVTLSVARGEIFGVIGQSGAGKSTLVRLINALERPGSGTITVDGLDIASLDNAALRQLRRRIGMIFQNFGLLSSRTAAENVAFPLKLSGMPRAAIDERVEELLMRVGIFDHADKYPAQLSGGQKQRVGIARALATRPDILLCDEATSALDPQTTRSVLKLLKELNKELGLTIVLITHEMEVVRAICDRVAVLDHGVVVESGSVADVFDRAVHPAAKRLVEALAEHHL